MIDRLAPWLLALVGLVLAGARLAVPERRPPRHAPTQIQFSRLTYDQALQLFPSLSPDGTQVVFFQDDGLWVQRVGGQRAIRIADDVAEASGRASFSPDGTRIAYRGADGVYVMGATGESPRKVSDEGYDPSWSPDGAQLLVTTAPIASPFHIFDYGHAAVIDLHTGEYAEIPVEADGFHATWSPDGERIAFWSPRREIWTMRFDGTELVQLTRGVDGSAWHPEWAPDGRALFYVAQDAGTTDVWRVEIEPDTGAAARPAEQVTTGVDGVIWGFDVAGDRLVLHVHQRWANLHHYTFDRERLALDYVGPVTRGRTTFAPGDISPDGTRVVTSTLLDQEHVFVVGLDGTGLRRIVGGRHRNRGPTWSPDGERLAFYSNRTGVYHVYTIRPDGSDLVDLTPEATDMIHTPAWRPDGTLVVTAEGHGAHLLSPGVGLEAMGAPFDIVGSSPSATRVIGLKDRRLFVAEASGEPLADLDGPVTFVDDDLVLHSGPDGLEVIDLRDGSREPVSMLAQGSDVTGVEVGPNGRDTLVLFDEQEADLWIADLTRQ